jgi:hypothetical protein
MFNLDTPRIKRQDFYLWADYIELQCIVNPDHLASYSDAFDELNYQDEGLGGIFAQPDEVLTPPDDASLDQHLLSPSDQVEFSRTDVAQIIKNRTELFKELYPFDVQDKSVISLKADLSQFHHVYLNQLIASNSRLLNDKSLASQYRTYFEKLSTFLLRVLFPEPFIIKHAGTTPPRDFSFYSGNYSEKMQQIAHDIHVDLLLEENELRRHSGDGGLDAVAWFDFGDKASHLPVILMQAGCTSSEEEMLTKSQLIGADNWRNKFKQIQALSFMFTPQCCRDGLGCWIKPSELGSVLIDRYRIMHLISNPGSPTAADVLNFGVESGPKRLQDILNH